MEIDLMLVMVLTTVRSSFVVWLPPVKAVNWAITGTPADKSCTSASSGNSFAFRPGSMMVDPEVLVVELSDLKKLMLTSVGGGTFVVVVID
jgi:hypothetical protein